MEVIPIANRLLKLSQEAGLIIRPMKIQKLLWFTHGWYSILFDSMGLFEEPFEAWHYGPVIPSIYHKFKKFYDNPINTLIYTSALNKKNYIINTDENVISICKQVFNLYGSTTDIALSDLTHEKDGAWWKAYIKGAGTLIEQTNIVEEFRKLNG